MEEDPVKSKKNDSLLYAIVCNKIFILRSKTNGREGNERSDGDGEQCEQSQVLVKSVGASLSLIKIRSIDPGYVCNNKRLYIARRADTMDPSPGTGGVK